ncbi:MAG: hypothetical protein ACPGXZ_10805 [Saprospiraceae bacterium]
MKSTLFTLIAVFGIAFCSISFKKKPVFHKLANKINYQLPGQTAPADMIFVAGNGDFESFYISATKEPNVNYIIYLQWLIKTYYESYPKVIFEALPNLEDSVALDNGAMSYPVLDYMTHPNYAYHPMVGLSWVQIQKYLAWKTDRLNEEILIETGILYRNFDQQDEDNFVTDTYLAYQYQGQVKSSISYKIEFVRDLKLKKERGISITNGILFTGFRLPTSAEWEYVNEKQSVEPASFNQKTHPFGNNHFMLNAPRKRGNQQLPLVKKRTWTKQVSMPLILKSILNYSVDSYINTIQKNMNITNNSYFPKDNYVEVPASYGAIHFETDIGEWVLNRHGRDTSKNWRSILEDGGFEMEQPAIYDENGNYVEKDSLGRMKNFRFVGMGSDGLPFEIDRYSKRPKLKRKLSDVNYQIGWLEKEVKNHPPYAASLQRLKKEKQVIEAQIIANSDIDRMVKGGQITHLQDNETSKKVGFRCILPFTGAPVLKGRKVKWE